MSYVERVLEGGYLNPIADILCLASFTRTSTYF